MAKAFCKPSISCLRRAWRSSKDGAFVSQLPLSLSKYSITAESSSLASFKSNFVSETKLSRRPFSACLFFWSWVFSARLTLLSLIISSYSCCAASSAACPSASALEKSLSATSRRPITEAAAPPAGCSERSCIRFDIDEESPVWMKLFPE